jgi:hypothetical protein
VITSAQSGVLMLGGSDDPDDGRVVGTVAWSAGDGNATAARTGCMDPRFEPDAVDDARFQGTCLCQHLGIYYKMPDG